MSKKVHLSKESLDQIDILIDELAIIRNREYITSNNESIEFLAVSMNNLNHWSELVQESIEVNQDRVD